MFRQVSTVVVVVMVAVGSLTMPGCSKQAEQTKPDAATEAGVGSKSENLPNELLRYVRERGGVV